MIRVAIVGTGGIAHAHMEAYQKLVFQCEKARISAPYDCFCSQPMPNGFPLKAPDPAFEKKAADFLASLPPLRYEHHAGQLDNVLTAIETGGRPAITGEDGRRTLELITAIYKAGSTHQAVTLPLEKGDPFYTVEGIRSKVPHFYEKTHSVMELGEGELTFGSDFGEKENK